jgi:hypothetical protein
MLKIGFSDYIFYFEKVVLLTALPPLAYNGAGGLA